MQALELLILYRVVLIAIALQILLYGLYLATQSDNVTLSKHSRFLINKDVWLITHHGQAKKIW